MNNFTRKCRLSRKFVLPDPYPVVGLIFRADGIQGVSVCHGGRIPVKLFCRQPEFRDKEEG